MPGIPEAAGRGTPVLLGLTCVGPPGPKRDLQLQEKERQQGDQGLHGAVDGTQHPGSALLFKRTAAVNNNLQGWRLVRPLLHPLKT